MKKKLFLFGIVAVLALVSFYQSGNLNTEYNFSLSELVEKAQADEETGTVTVGRPCAWVVGHGCYYYGSPAYVVSPGSYM